MRAACSVAYIPPCVYLRRQAGVCANKPAGVGGGTAVAVRPLRPTLMNPHGPSEVNVNPKSLALEFVPNGAMSHIMIMMMRGRRMKTCMQVDNLFLPRTIAGRRADGLPLDI